MNQKIQYGSSLPGTANDIEFALATMKQAGFVLSRPADIDLRRVACDVLGIDGDNEVEDLVSHLAQALADTSTPA
jgi:hypothetical protein